MKAKLNKKELNGLADAYLLNQFFTDNLKSVKTSVKTDELAGTKTGEKNGKSVHTPYELEGVVSVTVTDTIRETIDSQELIGKLSEFVDSDKLNQIVAEVTRKTPVHTVSIKPSKEYAVDFNRRIEQGLALLGKIDALKDDVRNKVLAMLVNEQC